MDLHVAANVMLILQQRLRVYGTATVLGDLAIRTGKDANVSSIAPHIGIHLIACRLRCDHQLAGTWQHDGTWHIKSS